MASAILTSSFCASSVCSSFSSTNRSPTVWGCFSTSVIALPSTNSNLQFFKWVPQLGLYQFAQWNGLKNLSISTSQPVGQLKLERKGGCKGKGVYASLFGVGAPEALVIGVVALLVFGPKGLAEVARNLGKTLRAFQPTIRELQEVSREFKSTLEREIGLDDIQNPNLNESTKASSSPPSSEAGPKPSQLKIDPNGSPSPSPSPSEAYSSEELLKITEEQLKSAAAKQQEESASSPVENQSGTASPTAPQQEDGSPGETQADVQTQPQVLADSPQEAASATPYSGKPERDT